MGMAIEKMDSESLFRLMPSEKAAATLELAAALKVFALAVDKAACAAEIARRFAPLGMKGLSAKSLYRKWQDFRREGVLALVDARTRRLASSGLAGNAEFLECWHALVLENRRKMRPAWSKLLRQFCREGRSVPGIGTWRDLYLERFGVSPAEGEPCPWGEGNPPPGWSLRNLTALAPRPETRLAAGRGVGAYMAKYGMTVCRTRAGLACCRVVEVDDFWCEHKVIFPGNSEPQRVVAFSALDRLTGHTVCIFFKPVRERGGGAPKEVLNGAWVRYVYHYLLCVTGIPREGCCIRGEHGTASMDATFASALSAINAQREHDGKGPVTFDAGAIVPRALAKGLPEGQAKGNPRHKGMIEQWHALFKNELADVAGEVGGGRGVKPEHEYGMVAEAKRLIAAGDALEESRPGIRARLAYGFPLYADFAREAFAAVDRVDGRTAHAMEGWEECGFMCGELRMAGSPHWTSIPAMERLPPKKAEALRRMVENGVAEYRARRMSPREAWESRKGELEPLPEFYAPLILGEELSKVCRVGDKGQMVARDPDTGERYVVAAIAGGRTLPRGETFRVWVNPMDGGKAYVSDMQGRFMGVAPVMRAARADADATVPELQRQLGLRSAALAEERRRLAPAIRRRLAERNADAARNLAALGVEDPVDRAAAAEAARAAMEGAEPVDASALVPASAPDEQGGISVADLL